MVRAPGHWYTNFPVINRTKYKNIKVVHIKDIPAKYKKYDDDGTLLVDNNWIPKGFNKPFAVSAFPILSGLLEQGYKIIEKADYNPYVDGKEKFRRILVQKVDEEKQE